VFDAMQHDAKLGFLINTPALGKAMAQTLGQSWVVLLRGHGDAVAGTSVREAVSYAIGAEQSAQQLAQAIALGGKVKYMTADEVKNQLGMSRGGSTDGADRNWQLWKSEIGQR
jgi:HCOMODA/2-hydroxy-3-carboxy-muconic semialdehyde decarboxylase